MNCFVFYVNRTYKLGQTLGVFYLTCSLRNIVRVLDWKPNIKFEQASQPAITSFLSTLLDGFSVDTFVIFNEIL